MPEVTLKSEPVTFDWPYDARARIWLLQPRATHLTEQVPRYQDDETWPLLKRLLHDERAETHGGPVIFFAPEWAIAPQSIEELKHEARLMPDHHLLVAGLGHLSRDQCVALDPETDNTLEKLASPAKFANCAFVATGTRWYLEGKRRPSWFDEEAGHHLKCSQVRLFTGPASKFKFAVVTCSDMLNFGEDDCFPGVLVNERPDVVFWPQHNPKPRNEGFRRWLGEFNKPKGAYCLVVGVNKGPNGLGREEYGGSALFAPADAFHSKKYHMCKAHWCTEPVTSWLTRATILRYDADAIQITTKHPRDLPRENELANECFIDEVVPCAWHEGALEPNDARTHLTTLFDLGRHPGRARAGLDAEKYALTSGPLAELEHTLSDSMNLFLCFLDIALLQEHSGDSRAHANHESHQRAASCNCWPHRANFDLLYEEQRRADVGELLLAAAAVDAFGNASVRPAEPTSGSPENLEVRDREGGGQVKLILAHAGVSAQEFERRYFGSGSTRRFAGATSAVALGVKRSGYLVQANAAQADLGPGTRADTTVETCGPRLYGAEFWDRVKLGTLARWLSAIKGRTDVEKAA
jgi:hypothetical protein